jgi:hypothetical protein
MATVRLFGPMPFDFGPGGLAPGQSTPTVWTLDPEPVAGTVTFTAFPRGLVQGDGTRLAVRNPTIQRMSPTAGHLGTRTVLHVEVVNVGDKEILGAEMYISCVVP